MTILVIAMTLFVGTHFLMSHPLRAGMVNALGQKGFLGVYSLVSLLTLGWAIYAFGQTGGTYLWTAPAWADRAGHAFMLIAFILFVGSLIAPNPALVGAEGSLRETAKPAGALKITRHPMMWSFAIWAAVHIALSGRSDTLVLAGGIGFLALAGAYMQDRKKERLTGEAWAAWERATRFFPGIAWPGWLPVVLGAVLYEAVVWFHLDIFGVSPRGFVGF